MRSSGFNNIINSNFLKKAIIGLILLLSFSSAVFSADKIRWFDDQDLAPELIEQRATQILRFYDPQGIVWVQRQGKDIFPARPESRADLIQTVEVFSKNNSKVKILVFTSLEKLPPDFLKSIRTAMSPDLQIHKVVSIPGLKPDNKSIAPMNPATEGSNEPFNTRGLASNVLPAVANNQPAQIALPATLTNQLEKFFEKEDGVLQKNSAWFLALGAGFLLLVVWMLKQMVSGLNQIPDALKNIQQNAGISGASSGVSSIQAQSLIQDVTQHQETIPYDLDQAATLVLFVDLIRSKKLGELNYYWERTSFANKRLVLEKLPQYRGVFSQLPQYKAVHSAYHQDAAYLTLTIQDVDVSPEQLSAKIKTNTEWVTKISQLQRTTLKLPIAEKLELFEKYQELLGPQKLHLSLQEEEVLGQASKIKDYWIENCVSILWLKTLPPESVQSILSSWNALDLASIWNIPENMKSLLSTNMVPEKVELVQFYLQKNGAGRNEKVIERIYEQILNEHYRTITKAA